MAVSLLYSLSQDGFGQVWSHDLLTEIISEEVISHDIHTVPLKHAHQGIHY